MNRTARRIAILAATVMMMTIGMQVPSHAVSGRSAAPAAAAPATCSSAFVYPLQAKPSCSFRYAGGPLQASLDVVAAGGVLPPIGAWTIAVDVRQLGASQDPGCAAGGNLIAIFGACSGRTTPTVPIGTRLTCRLIFLSTLVAVGSYRCGVALISGS